MWHGVIDKAAYMLRTLNLVISRILMSRLLISRFLMVLLLGSCSPSVETLSASQMAQRERVIQEALAKGVAHLNSSAETSLAEAMASFHLAWQVAPEDPRVLDALGCIYYRLGQYETARNMFKEAIRRNEKYDRPYVHLALLAEQEGQPKAAAELLSMAVRLNPLNFRAHNNLAALLLNHGDAETRGRALSELWRAKAAARRSEQMVEGNIERFSPDVLR